MVLLEILLVSVSTVNVVLNIQQIRAGMFLFLSMYDSFLVYCHELAPCIISLTGDRAQGEDSKHDSHYNLVYQGMAQVNPCSALGVSDKARLKPVSSPTETS